MGVQRKDGWGYRRKLNWPGFKEREKVALGKTPAEIGQKREKDAQVGFCLANYEVMGRHSNCHIQLVTS